MHQRLRVVVADDSSTYRRLVREVLVDIPYVDLVGVASNGQEAVEAARTRKPDLLTLDLEMPFLNGLDVLRELRREKLNSGAIVLSAESEQSAVATNQALRLGAFDFIVKPMAGCAETSRRLLRESLESRLLAFARARYGEDWVGNRRVESTAAAADPAPRAPAAGGVSSRTRPRVLAIGVSTGGPVALTNLLPNLPADFCVPIVIVQHMPPLFTKSLAEDLDRRCAITVREGVDQERVQPGVAYIAPGGKHMKLVADGATKRLAVTDDPPERNCRPSVDYLFRSVANTYRGDTLAVVMTGMGDDGAAGSEAIKKAGGTVIAQDEASSVVFGMPRRVIELELADEVLPLDQMAGRITDAVNRRRRAGALN